MQVTPKPVECEARQWDGTRANANELIAWIAAGGMQSYFDLSQFPDAVYVVVNTLNGPLHARPQDWLVKGATGEFSVYKPDVFTAAFDPK